MNLEPIVLLSRDKRRNGSLTRVGEDCGAIERQPALKERGHRRTLLHSLNLHGLALDSNCSE
jgi:hypothetical protein